MGQVAGVVRQVGVHFEHQVGAAGEGVAKARQIGLAEALLAGSVQHLDVGVFGGERSASSPVPSGEASSTMSVWSCRPLASATSRMRTRAWRRLSRSL